LSISYQKVKKFLNFLDVLLAHQCWLVEYPVGSGTRILLVAGGFNTFKSFSGAPVPGGLASTETYDFAKDVWTKSGNLPTLRSDGRSLTIRNRHLWFGGRSGTVNVSATSEILEFSLQSGWVPLQMALVSTASVPIVIPYNL
jgi:hypothetical protein